MFLLVAFSEEEKNRVMDILIFSWSVNKMYIILKDWHRVRWESSIGENKYSDALNFLWMVLLDGTVQSTNSLLDGTYLKRP